MSVCLVPAPMLLQLVTPLNMTAEGEGPPVTRSPEGAAQGEARGQVSSRTRTGW